MEKLKETLIIGGIIVFAVALYFFMPALFTFFSKNCRGIRGVILLGAISLVVFVIFCLFGYKGSSLIKIALLILFIAAMIWLYFNYRDVDVFISGRYGQGIATLVFLGIVLVIFLLMKFLL